MGRYLHFNTFDLSAPSISSQCSACGHEFTADLQPGEQIEDVVERVRDQFNRHEVRNRRERRYRTGVTGPHGGVAVAVSNYPSRSRCSRIFSESVP